MWLIGQLRSRVRYKIIWPFLLLAVCIAIFGSTIAFSLIASSWQERFVNQIASSTRIANDALLAQERSNLLFLRQIALSGANTQTGAPAVSAALADNDTEGLIMALDPFVRVGIADTNVQLDRLILFDTGGQALVDMERDARSDTGYHLNPGRDVSHLWFVPLVLEEHTADEDDKYAGLIVLADEFGNPVTHLATVVPVRQDENAPIVGGALMAISLENLLTTLLQRSHAAIVTIYDIEGTPLVSSAFPSASAPAALDVPDEYTQARASIDDLQMAEADLAKLKASAQTENLDDLPVVTTIAAAGRSYEVFYTYLVVHNARVGILSTGMPTDYVSQWSDGTRPMILGLTILVMLAVIAVGMAITRQVTAPLEQLVATAGAFVSGGSSQGGQAAMLPDHVAKMQDEVSILSASFKHMTEQQRRLIRDVLRESGLRAAILESIPDGLVVCDSLGRIQSMNPMMYRFLALDADADLPPSFHDLPLQAVDEPIFGLRVNDLYMLNERFLRVSKSPILINKDTYVGDVYVLQDMTAEVKVDQAKTTFTATISHEMRTPLTVINGNAQFLQRGLLGELNPDQQTMVDGIFRHSSSMSRALFNAILAAELDSGSVSLSPEELDVGELIQEVAFPLQRQIQDKGLELTIAVPDNLPAVYADRIMFPRTLEQVLHNAYTYTQTGNICISAQLQASLVCINVCDSGSGIAPELLPQVFDRFVRGSGDEANNRSERGIGLGLAIARQLIELQHGRIWIEASSDLGTTVSITLPLVDAAAPGAASDPDQASAIAVAETCPDAYGQPATVPHYPVPDLATLALPSIAACLSSSVLPASSALERALLSLQQAGFLSGEKAAQQKQPPADLGQLPAGLFQELLLEALPVLHERWHRRQRPLSPLTEWARRHFVAVLALDETSPSSTGMLTGRSQHARPLFAESHISGLIDVSSRLPHALWYDEVGGMHWLHHFWERAYAVLQPDTLLIAAPSSQAYAAMAGISDQGISMIVTNPPAHGWHVLQRIEQSDHCRDRIVQFQQRRRAQNRTLRLVERREQGKVYRYLTTNLDPAILPARQMHLLCTQQRSIRAMFLGLSQILAREHGALYSRLGSSPRNVAQLQIWSAWLLYVTLIDAADQLAERLQCTGNRLPLATVYHHLWQYRLQHANQHIAAFDVLVEQFATNNERQSAEYQSALLPGSVATINT